MFDLLGDRIRKTINHDNDDFLELVTLAGLNPSTDFRGINLSEIKFSYMDLDGFDFTGANLTGCSFYMALVDKTVFDDEQLKLATVKAAIAFSKEKRFSLVEREVSKIFRKYKPSIIDSDEIPHHFSIHEIVLHPRLGVGVVEEIKTEVIAGYNLKIFSIKFENALLILPCNKAEASIVKRISDLFDIDATKNVLKLVRVSVADRETLQLLKLLQNLNLKAKRYKSLSVQQKAVLKRAKVALKGYDLNDYAPQLSSRDLMWSEYHGDPSSLVLSLIHISEPTRPY